MHRHRTNIYLDARQIEMLDRLATAQGSSRAALIRQFVDRTLAGAGDTLEADLAAIDESFGALAHVELDDRAHGGREEHLAWMSQLRPRASR